MLCKFRHEKAAPTDLFPKNGSEIFDHGNRCRKAKIQRDGGPCGKGAESKLFREEGNKWFVVELSKSTSPCEHVYGCGISKRDEITNNFISRVAPFPSNGGYTAAEILTGEECCCRWAPHQTAYVVDPNSAASSGT